MSILEEGYRSPGGSSRNRPHGNLNVLRASVLIVFAILTVRLVYMQIINGAEYARRSRENHIVEKNILPTRGLILDRNGQPLVQNVGVYTATLVPELLPKDQASRYKIYLRLEELTGASALDIQSKVKRAEENDQAYIEVQVQKYLTKEQALRLDEASVDMPGVSLSVTPGRTYPMGNEFSSLLGYIGAQTPEEAKNLGPKGYQLNEPVGKDGIEARYEDDLRGEVGFTANEQDAQGNLINALQTKDPVPGNSLKLAIDADLQKYVAELLQDSLDGTNGSYGPASVAAAVVMNPKTGEVYSMVSIPSYDNNIFAQPDARANELSALYHDNRHPFLNQALTSAAPGSTFKIVTATAGLETGNVTPNTTRCVNSKVLEIKGETGQIFDFLDWREQGCIDLRHGIAYSSNIYMYMTAGGIAQEGIPGLGGYDLEKSGVILANWARKYGFGAPTGIDLFNEAAGRVPDPGWKRRNYADPPYTETDRQWYLSDVYFTAIGQQDVLATPMQIARMTAAVANGGKLVTPHVVDEVIGPDGKTIRTIKTALKDVGVSAANIQVVKEGMHLSVTDSAGAGIRAYTPGIDIAGKTGTAEFYLPDGTKSQHAWFTGFAPYNDPDVVVTVYFDIGVGGDKAAPVASKIFKYFMANVKTK
jgi:penicillin-binding protein 2